MFGEFDFSGANGGNEYNSNSHAMRLRHIYGTVGDWTFGQSWSLWSDRATLPNSVENNGPVGPESGVRQPLVSYLWNIDPAQKNQLQFSVENPFSDFLGADTQVLNGAAVNNAANFNHKYPDVLARFGHNEPWGRIFVTGMVRDLSIDDAGVAGLNGTANRFVGASKDATTAWGVASGAKIYTGFLNPKNAIYVHTEIGQGIGRYMNVNSGSQNPSAVLDATGHLKAIEAGSYEVSYQHFLNSSNTWQANVIWGEQKIWQKPGYMSAAAVQGLPTDYQELELNLMWSPNSYVMMGPAYIRANTRVVAPQNLVGVAGATRTTSGTTAIDNRFQFSTNIGF
jgi:hypothetical protein